MPTRTKVEAKIPMPTITPLMRRISLELQPVEFTDVVYGDTTDLFEGPQQYVLLIANVSLLNGVLLLFGGIVILAFETHVYFTRIGLIFTALGGFLLLAYIGLEWWSVRKSMNKELK